MRSSESASANRRITEIVNGKERISESIAENVGKSESVTAKSVA